MFRYMYQGKKYWEWIYGAACFWYFLNITF